MVEGWKEISLNEIGWFKGAGVNKLSNIDEHPVYLINYMDVYKHWQIYFNNNYQEVTAKEREKKEANLLVGDILFTPSSEKPIDIGHAGIIMEEMPDCVYSYHLIRYRLNDKSKFDMNFISYLLNSDEVQKHFVSRASGSGIRYTLSLNDFKSLKIRFPQKTEQVSIANILSKVDEAIESVKKSIEAAEKLKKSLMQNLLTGRMKPDGTLRTEEEFYEDEKFGKVPIGWEVKAIGDKKVCQINPVYKYKRKEIYDFIPMEAVKERFSGLDYVEKQLIDNGSYTRFKAGDILFAKITPCSENGKVAYIEHVDSEVGFASTEFIVFHPTDEVDGHYIYHLLTSENIHRLAISLMEGTTGRQRIPWKIFKNRIFVPLPCKEEQTNIVNRILVFDKQINNYYNRINILETLKKSLMQNLLTGKVRVGDIEIKGGLQNG